MTPERFSDGLTWLGFVVRLFVACLVGLALVWLANSFFPLHH